MAHQIKYLKRKQKDFAALQQSTDIKVALIDDNMDQWLFLFDGPIQTPFEGGQYMGKLKLDDDWPIKPPVISVLTPNGRFVAGNAICINGLSHYHNESYSSTTTVEMIIRAMISFMAELGKEATDHAGGVHCTNEEIKTYTEKSKEWNLKNKLYKQYFM